LLLFGADVKCCMLDLPQRVLTSTSAMPPVAKRKPGKTEAPAAPADDAADAAALRQQLEKKIARCDVQIFDLETSYLDFVADHRATRHVGSLLGGWGRHQAVKKEEAAAGKKEDEPVARKRGRAGSAAALAAPSPARHPASLRLFTMCSGTALASCEAQGREL
jgi:hypothetical protein